MKINIVLGLFLVILSSIIIGELVFYSHLQSTLNNKHTTIVVSPTPVETSVPSPTPPYTDWFAKKESIMTSASSLDKSDGIIVDIKQDSSAQSVLQMTIKGKNGKYSYSFSSSDVAATNVVNLVGNKEQQYNLDSLKVNDSVTIEETWDNFRQIPERTSVKIVKHSSGNDKK